MMAQPCTKGEVSVALPLPPKQGAHGETSTEPFFLRPFLHCGAVEADCPELSAQQATVNNYFIVALLVLNLLSSSPANQRKTH